VDASGIDAKQHIDAVAGALCGMGRGHSRVEPEADGGTAQVVRPGSERREHLLRRERELLCLGPRVSVVRAENAVAAGAEEAAVGGGVMIRELGLPRGDQGAYTERTS
jgi:hypothetical protein